MHKIKKAFSPFFRKTQTTKSQQLDEKFGFLIEDAESAKQLLAAFIFEVNVDFKEALEASESTPQKSLKQYDKRTRKLTTQKNKELFIQFMPATNTLNIEPNCNEEPTLIFPKFNGIILFIESSASLVRCADAINQLKKEQARKNFSITIIASAIEDAENLKQNIENFSAQTNIEPTYRQLALDDDNKLSPETVTEIIEMISPTLSAERIPVVMPQP